MPAGTSRRRRLSRRRTSRAVPCAHATHTGAAFTGQSHIGRHSRQRPGSARVSGRVVLWLHTRSSASRAYASHASAPSRRVACAPRRVRTENTLSNLCLCLSLTLCAFPRSYSKALNPGRSSLDPRSLAGVRGPGPGSRALAWDPHLPITNLQQRQIQQHKQEIKQKLDHQIPPWHDMSIVLVADEAAIDPRSSHGMQIRLSSA